MQLQEILPGSEGKFLHRYDLRYRLENGAEKRYEVVTRNRLAAPEDVPGREPDGVVMVVLNGDGSKVLLNREFRPAVNMVLYNFPAGLTEPGETPQQAAARELREETGLHMQKCLALYGKSYGAVGLSNESALVLVCTADEAEAFGGNHDPNEEIVPVWVDKAEAEAIVQSGKVTARVQMFLAMWGCPFAGRETPSDEGAGRVAD